jgi:hypothetical protein
LEFHKQHEGGERESEREKGRGQNFVMPVVIHILYDHKIPGIR